MKPVTVVFSTVLMATGAMAANAIEVNPPNGELPQIASLWFRNWTRADNEQSSS